MHLEMNVITIFITGVKVPKGHIFFKDFIYLFLEWGREGERERNINVWLPLELPLLGSRPATQV